MLRMCADSIQSVLAGVQWASATKSLYAQNTPHEILDAIAPHPLCKPPGIYARGAAGCDRHHWDLDRAIAAGRAGGQGGGPPHAVQQQPAANRARLASARGQ